MDQLSPRTNCVLVLAVLLGLVSACGGGNGDDRSASTTMENGRTVEQSLELKQKRFQGDALEAEWLYVPGEAGEKSSGMQRAGRGWWSRIGSYRLI